MKILISSCVLGNKVRWNGACRQSDDIQEWADECGFVLVPVCPENSLFGTPRKPIKLHQIADQIMAMMGRDNVYPELREECQKLISEHSDAVGYIGISGSPSCGIASWVQGRKKPLKSPMHELSPWSNKLIYAISGSVIFFASLSSILGFMISHMGCQLSNTSIPSLGNNSGLPHVRFSFSSASTDCILLTKL